LSIDRKIDMKQIERKQRPGKTRPVWHLVGATGVALAIGVGVQGWLSHTTTHKDTTAVPPVPVTTQAPASPDAMPSALSASASAQLPATLPPGITLVSTVPDTQPPQATLLLDGRLQAQPLGSGVGGSGLQVREITAEGITLGLSGGQPLYTLRVTPAAEVARLMAEARAQRLLDRPATQVAPVGEQVVQQDASRTTALPDEMKVTVHRRQPATSGPVGSL
jgi:hypothetical protein